MERFEIGDKVIARRKDAEGNDVELRGSVGAVTERGTPAFIGGIRAGHLAWEFELVERNYRLPTEPGIYSASRAGDEIAIHNYRSFRLDSQGLWSEMGSGRSPEDVLRMLEGSSMRLRKLVVEAAE